MKRKINYKKLLSFLLVFALMLPTSMTTLAAPDEGMAETTAITKDESSNVDTTKENEETIVTNDSSENKNEVISDETKHNENSTTNTTLAAPDESAVENTAVTKDEGINVDEAKENEETLITDDSSENEVTQDEEKDNKNNTTDEAENKTILKASSKVKAKAVEEELKNGINVITQSVSGKTFNIDDGKCISIEGPTTGDAIGDEIIFENCTFNLSGNVVNINSDYSSKLAFFGNVILKNCTISAIGASAKGAGTTAIISMFNGANVTLDDCTIIGTDCNYQFMAAYGTVTSHFNNSSITVTGNNNGWVFVSYPGEKDTVTMNFNKTDFTANDGNIRVYAQNQNNTGTTITNITNNSRIIFDDNKGGGFVFGKGTNQVNIDKSIVDVSNNGGNASNGGVWTVIDSTLTINGNRGGHGLSCQYFQMTNSKFESIHNGYAGVFTGTDDSSFTNCDVTIQCNGENLLSYSGLDITLNGHTLTVDNCGIAYLGTVGRSGNVITTNGSRVVMADAAQFGVDSHSHNIKSNCTPVITDNTKLATATSHYLFTNPNVDTKYARGNTEKDNVNYVSNDADLWLDVLYDKEGKAIEKTVKEVVTAVDSQYIDIFNDNELAHHTYNWSKGTITDKATETKYGVMAYECTTCYKYLANTDNHPNSYNCRGTYVYAPLVGVTFDSNAGNDEVNNMPEAQTAINYADAAVEPNQVPQRVSKDNVSYAFTGWYTDKECTEKFDFSTELTDNWTILYAGWKEQTSVSVTKVWDDENNQDGKRPESVTITLLANGEETDYTITLNADNNWEGIFTGLDKYADEKEILYTVKEIEVEGYSSKITGDAENGFVITNTHTPEKLGEVSVTKVWDDENDKDGKRPESVTITLLANGEETNYTITLNADNNWEGIFTGLDKYADGKEILYTVKETEIEGYTSKITGDVENGFVITNTHTPEKVVINSGTKGISIINTVKTGDTSSFAYLILLLIGSVTGIGVLGIRRRK